ncbi:MAG: hypothetical protein IJR48_07670, partial [Oscillibacter sp.]|nr:hypothetical protein [Oscillibacter sp.]
MSKRRRTRVRLFAKTERNPAFLVFLLSLIVMAASALLFVSECGEAYATARYWRDLSARTETGEILPSLR